MTEKQIQSRENSRTLVFTVKPRLQSELDKSGSGDRPIF